MKTLNKVHGWTMENCEQIGKYRDENGLGLSGFYRREYKKNYEMVVLNNGYSLCRYKYPKLTNLPHTSHMLSWSNLLFCGGYKIRLANGEYAGSNERLFEAVSKGNKPMGFMVFRSTEELNKMTHQIEESNLQHSISERNHSAYPYEIGLANNGTFGEWFDLNSVVEAYRLFSKELGFNVLSHEDELSILNLKERKLSTPLNGFDYSSPFKNNFNHVLTGLILGYPIESTIAFLIGQVY